MSRAGALVMGSRARRSVSKQSRYERSRTSDVTESERRSAAMRMTRKRVAEPGAEEVERYAGAFARVRLVRAWIAAAAAMVAMLYAYVALLERVVR